jgi:molybdopterin-guanine dinucleotide biosynthesis protein A
MIQRPENSREEEPHNSLGANDASLAAIILCGGKSERMGSDKAMLPFGSEAMLQRIVRIVSAVASPVVVVAADGQDLPLLPTHVSVVRDTQPDRGPLGGLSDGLRALTAPADCPVFVTGCDCPLVTGEFIKAVLEQLPLYRIAAPVVDRVVQPLGAVYRRGVLSDLEAALERGQSSLRKFIEQDPVGAHRFDANLLRTVDPELLSLFNVNTPEAYQAALRRVAGDGE